MATKHYELIRAAKGVNSWSVEEVDTNKRWILQQLRKEQLQHPNLRFKVIKVTETVEVVKIPGGRRPARDTFKKAQNV